MRSASMLKELKDFWDDWGIEVLVAMSCAMHIVLTLFGSRRRFMKTHEFLVRFIIWSTYLLSNFVATAVFSKLTFTPVSDFTKEITDSELRGLFAPLLLVQLGSLDSITAYSIQDAGLAHRQFLNLFVQLSAVLWILFSFWTNSAISYLYLPFLLAGFIKYAENAWALSTALRASSRITIRDFKPDCELGFGYDGLYTKAPIVYTRMGFALRLVSSLNEQALGKANCDVTRHFYSDRILAFLNLDIEIRKYFCTTSLEIDIGLKKIVIEFAKKVKEATKTNNTGGEWALMGLSDEIVFHYAYSELMEFLKADDSSSITDIKTACKELLARNFYVSPDPHEEEQTIVTHDWDVLSDAKKLSTELLNMNEILNVSEKWEMICVVWTAMLCIVARNCPADYYAETLRRDGEFATLVWFLLLH
ncbi:hypothetical protein FEM48_Zijuj01G0110300 [Ziziphus jujuba var. spinosa]|uniref:DUF4220 domain-containing protein n=1 Tax=Ziziphus jujuba var. spinosa TaxID=714518 RepID=A0A978W0W3_ZIZJJ|nr:hypothetical protein FEM48_Zijuj01G0110300 [Ziziphus jujuba var. spinosa]